MTSPPTSERTSRAGLEQHFLWSEIEFDQTGWDLGGSYQIAVLTYEAVQAAEVTVVKLHGAIEPAADLASRAAAFARVEPHRESLAPPVPQLSGNLAKDVHDLCGLSWKQVAAVFGISERAAAGWRTQGVPAHREETMEALRAIGATLVGGLGPEGVARWLAAGEPSRLQRLRDGEVEAVASEARSYLDGPAG
jgi:hypothetical protein